MCTCTSATAVYVLHVVCEGELAPTRIPLLDTRVALKLLPPMMDDGAVMSILRQQITC